MTQAERSDHSHSLDRKRYPLSGGGAAENLDSIDVLRSVNLKDGISSVHYYSSHNHLEPRLYDQESGVSSTHLNNNLKRSESFVEKVKRLLRVDSDDDTDNLHNKYKESSKDREEKLKMFEQQLNIKINSPKRSGNLLLNSYMTTSILFLSITVLLLLSVFLIFKLTTRIESLENILENIQDYIEKKTLNNTESGLVTDRDRGIPGIFKGRRNKDRS